MMPVALGTAVVRVSLVAVDFRLGMDGLSLRAQAVVAVVVNPVVASSESLRVLSWLLQMA